jgi:hypothetical protein
VALLRAQGCTAHFVGKIGELPPFEMFPMSAKDFYITNFDARFTFEVDAQGRTAAIVMHTDSDVRAPRVP